MDDKKQKELLDAQITMRLDICSSQLITIFCEAIQTEIRICDDYELLFKQWEQCGILIHFESLLTTIGNEAGMLEDFEYTMRYLNRRVYITVCKKKKKIIIF